MFGQFDVCFMFVGYKQGGSSIKFELYDPLRPSKSLFKIIKAFEGHWWLA